mgnify:CR=1 FL=1
MALPERARRLFRGQRDPQLEERLDADAALHCDFDALPPGARVVYLDAWRHPAGAGADVFLPISVQTERSGHYTNFAGVVSRFEACFEKPPGVAHAESLFAALAVPARVEAA